MKIIKVSFDPFEKVLKDIDEGFQHLSPSQRKRFLEYSGLVEVPGMADYCVRVEAFKQGDLIHIQKDSEGDWTWDLHNAGAEISSDSVVCQIPGDFRAGFAPRQNCLWETDDLTASDGRLFRLCGDGFGSLLAIGLSGKRRPDISKLVHLVKHADTLYRSVDMINEELDAEHLEQIW